MLLVILTESKLLELFTKKELHKENQKEFRVINYKLNGKATIALLIAALIKEEIIQRSEYFPEPKYYGGRVKVDLDLSNFAAKVDLEKATGVDTSNFVWKVDIASIKSEVAKLDTDKLEKVPTGWNSLKSKVDKLDVKIDAYNGKSQIFKVKYLILLT